MATTPYRADRDTPDELTGLGGLVHLRDTVAGWREDWRTSSRPCPINAMLVSIGRIDTVNVSYGETAGDLALSKSQGASGILRAMNWKATLAGNTSRRRTFPPCARAEMSSERWQWLAEALADALAAPMANPSGESSLRLWPDRPDEVGASDDVDIMLDRLSEVSARLRMGNGRRITVERSDQCVPARISNSSRPSGRDRTGRNRMLFQPQFSLTDDSVIGAKRSRWHHPSLAIGSYAFQIAERADHVAQLSRLSRAS